MKRPFFIENSRVPVWLSKFVPIDIWALNIGPWVWCRGELSKTDKQHESIHYLQQLELLFVGQWILYGLFYLLGLIRSRSGTEAYARNPFEQEAYANENVDHYLATRNAYSWTKYKL